MTNLFLSDRGAGLAGELVAPTPNGGKHRPVKVVEHPAFAARRRVLAEARAEAFTVLMLPVVSLDPRPVTPPPDWCSMDTVA